MSDETIQFLDLATVHRELQDEFVDILKTALSNAGFIGGRTAQGFEEDFAQFCESRFCVGVGSGTDALRFGLMVAGNEAPRSKLWGITELKQSELPEIFAGFALAAARTVRRSASLPAPSPSPQSTRPSKIRRPTAPADRRLPPKDLPRRDCS